MATVVGGEWTDLSVPTVGRQSHALGTERCIQASTSSSSPGLRDRKIAERNSSEVSLSLWPGQRDTCGPPPEMTMGRRLSCEQTGRKSLRAQASGVRADGSLLS